MYRKALLLVISVFAISIINATVLPSWLQHLPEAQQENYLRSLEYDEYKCDGSKILKGSFFNDDFCDCLDGTDEPRSSGMST